MLLFSSASFAASQKDSGKSELRFQFGVGMMISTSNMAGLIESVKMAQKIAANKPYTFPGVTTAQATALNNLNGAMQRALLVANILGSMEYGIQARILWHIMMLESDLVLLPFGGSYNGRVDLLLTVMGGIRCPWWIMPYLLAGVNFTFSFYPAEFTKIENWKGKWAATDNFAFRPGMSVRAGLDFKFSGFSIGAYYQYSIKDFDEFGKWVVSMKDSGISASEAAGIVFGEQSRFGAALCWYFF
jgi:hypothetical protein